MMSETSTSPSGPPGDGGGAGGPESAAGGARSFVRTRRGTVELDLMSTSSSSSPSGPDDMPRVRLQRHYRGRWISMSMDRAHPRRHDDPSKAAANPRSHEAFSAEPARPHRSTRRRTDRSVVVRALGRTPGGARGRRHRVRRRVHRPASRGRRGRPPGRGRRGQGPVVRGGGAGRPAAGRHARLRAARRRRARAASAGAVSGGRRGTRAGTGARRAPGRGLRRHRRCGARARPPCPSPTAWAGCSCAAGGAIDRRTDASIRSSSNGRWWRSFPRAARPPRSARTRWRSK